MAAESVLDEGTDRMAPSLDGTPIDPTYLVRSIERPGRHQDSSLHVVCQAAHLEHLGMGCELPDGPTFRTSAEQYLVNFGAPLSRS